MGTQEYCYWCDRPLPYDHGIDPCGDCSKDNFTDLDEIWLTTEQKTGKIGIYGEYEQSVIFPQVYQRAASE